MEIKLMKRHVRNKAIHFAFSEVDFPKIIHLAKKMYQTAIVNLVASGVDLDDLNIQKCNEFELTVSQETGIASISAQKQVNDTALLPSLFAMQEMNPDAISVMVSELDDTNDFFWEINILYYENVATVCYQPNIFKKEVVKQFGECFVG